MSKRQRPLRSQPTEGQPKINPSGFPYGTGSIQQRRSTWWAIYRDAEGRIIQENTKTTDRDQARRFLAERALATLRAKVDFFQAVLDETETGAAAADRREPHDDRGQRGPRRRTVPADSARRKTGTRTKGGCS